jgi:hypothetical protein
MASARQALMLALTFTVIAAARAQGQPLAPNSLAPPDPAAVFLEPIQAKPGPTQSGIDLPYDVQAPLPAPKPREESSPAQPIAKPTTLRAAWLEPSPSDGTVSKGEYEDSLRKPRPAPPAPATDPYDYLSDGRLRKNDKGKLVRTERPWDVDLGNDAPTRKSHQLGDSISEGWDNLTGAKGGGGHNWFCPERGFDCFISPISNPFLFEDPRSLTEIRGIMSFQGIPSGNNNYGGGSADFFGVQGRLAITERLSVTMNKLGVQTLSPNGGTGLSELWLGPKYEIIRNPDTQTLVSVGGIFQIPLGSSSVYQNTGALSIVPYVSAAQKLFETDWGRINGMATAGYAISTNNARSDYFYLSGHIDYDVMNLHKFFPLMELNWFSVTTNGTSNPAYNFEGRDLVNFGANAKGNNLLTMALGGRWRFNDRWTVGGAFEFGIAGRRDIFQNRFMMDLTWRY